MQSISRTAKQTADNFDGSQIGMLMKDFYFVNQIDRHELNTWNSFKDVVNNFPCIHKESSCRELLKKMVSAVGKPSSNISIKAHFIFSYLESFVDNLEITINSKEKCSTKT